VGVPGYLWKLFREAPSKRRLIRSLILGTKGGDRTVTSADGTMLSVRRSGEGDPLVLVHGSLSGINAFSMVELTFAGRYSTWVYDRRGRGGSGDGPEYSLDREIEDLEAVLEAAGGPAHVLGHSYGAIIALAAAASGVSMRSLALYEPPVLQDRLDRAVVDRVVSLVGEGDIDRAIAVMTVELAGISEEEIAVPRSVKTTWNQLRDAAGAIERELAVVEKIDWSRLDLPVADRPVLVLRGGRDAAPVYPRLEDLPRFVTDPEIVTIPDQGHVAVNYAPFEFAGYVLGFVDRH
jgi:pimeloyl-ACP methyl ester carboxylesterase